MKIQTPNSILEEELNELFLKKKSSDIDLIFSTLTLLLTKNEYNTDLVDSLKILGIDTFVKMVHLFSGRTIDFPKTEDFREALLLTICYYYHAIENKTWKEIEEIFPEVNNYEKGKLSLSLKITNLDTWIKQKMQEQLMALSHK